MNNTTSLIITCLPFLKAVFLKFIAYLLQMASITKILDFIVLLVIGAIYELIFEGENQLTLKLARNWCL